MQWCALILFMVVMPTCMSVKQVHAVPLKAKEGIGFSRTGVADGCEPSCVFESNLSLLEDQPVLLTTKPPLQLQWYTFVILSLLTEDRKQRQEDHPNHP